MKSFFFLIAFLAIVSAIKPGVKVALKDDEIDAVKAQVIKTIMPKLKDLSVADVKTKKDGITIEITSIKASVNNIDPAQISVEFVQGTNSINIKAGGISGSGSAHLKLTELHIVHESMDVTMSFTNIGFSCTLQMTLLDAKPHFSINNFVFNGSKDNFDIEFHGSVIAKILDWVKDLFEDTFYNLIKNAIENDVPSTVTSMLNAVVATFPTQVDIIDGLVLVFNFTAAPLIESDYLCAGIMAYVANKTSPIPPPFEPVDMPDYNTASSKNLQFFLSEYTVQSALYAAYNAGLIKFSYAPKFLLHILNLNCEVLEMPKVTFDKDIKMTANASCSLSLFDEYLGEGNCAFLFRSAISVDLTENIRNATFYFNISDVEMLDLYITIPIIQKVINGKFLKGILNKVLNDCAEELDKKIGKIGIPLPAVEGVNYNNTDQTLNVGYLEVDTSPILNLVETYTGKF